MIMKNTQSRGQKVRCNQERMINSSQSTHSVGRVLWEELLEEFILHIGIYYTLMFFNIYAFKGQVHVFAGRVLILSRSSCRTSAMLKYFCPMQRFLLGTRNAYC